MSARTVMVLCMVLNLAYQGWYTYLEIKQRKNPLPQEISDIYDEDRYKKFLEHESDLNRFFYISEAISLLIEIGILFSPLFEKLDRALPGRPYAVFLLTFLVYQTIGIIGSLIQNYIYTFKIEEKYGLNKKTKKEFAKDFAIDQITGLVSVLAIFLVLIFIGEHMATWTGNFSVGWKTSLIITVVLYVIIAAVVSLVSVLELVSLKKKYTFTPMEKGELRDKIEGMLIGAKKVKQIYVYDESKKSVEKNAFLLKFLWHREFGIADNFLNENSERELLAVLSHEIGHLKHKKNIWDFISYGFLAMVAAAVAVTIKNPAFFLNMNAWVRESFGIAVNNYFILLSLYGMILVPISFVVSLYSHFVSRRKEREADMEAVKNGYGEDMIAMFKRLSSDELIDIYPHPIIEFIEDDHPGMYNRIKYIREATDLKNSEVCST